MYIDPGDATEQFANLLVSLLIPTLVTFAVERAPELTICSI